MIFAILFFASCAALLWLAAGAPRPKVLYRRPDDFDWGTETPWWLAFCWSEPYSMRYVYAFLPLGLLLRGVHRLSLWARFGPYPGAEVRQLQDQVRQLKNHVEYLEEREKGRQFWATRMTG